MIWCMTKIGDVIKNRHPEGCLSHMDMEFMNKITANPCLRPSRQN